MTTIREWQEKKTLIKKYNITPVIIQFKSFYYVKLSAVISLKLKKKKKYLTTVRGGSLYEK